MLRRLTFCGFEGSGRKGANATIGTLQEAAEQAPAEGEQG